MIGSSRAARHAARVSHLLLALAVALIAATLAAAPASAVAQTRKTSRTTAKKPATKRAATTRKTTKKTAAKPKGKQSATSISGLKNQRAQLKKQMQEQERKLKSNEKAVRERLTNLMALNTEIKDKKRSIDTIRRDLTQLGGNISQLDARIVKLDSDLTDRKRKYVKSLRYMHRNHNIQSRLMFVFSADNLTQMYRRLRFSREYAAYQRAQGEQVRARQDTIKQRKAELAELHRRKRTLLTRGETERKTLETKQTEQQQVVSSLQKQQKTIQSVLAQQRKKDAEINAQIDRLIAIEVERARQRAAAEAKRQAEARTKKERDEAVARAAAAKRDRDREIKAVEARRTTEAAPLVSSEDRRISGSFESNRGRLPIPVGGGYRIVSHFGQYNVEGLANVRLDNKGINIQGQPGAAVRSIYDGEVSAVFSLAGTTGVMVRHGSYISVYCNLGSVSVSRGQKVSTRQRIGSVGGDGILQFQLRREKDKLNPESWLGR